MMKKWNIYIIALLLLGSSCTDESAIELSNGRGDSSELTLTLKFPQASDMTKASTITPEDENRVDRLDILVFKKASSGTYLDDVLAYRMQVSGSAISSSTSPLPNGVVGDTKTVQVKVQSMQENQRFILLANLPDGTLNVADTAGAAIGSTTLGTIVNKLSYSGASWQKDHLSSVAPAFPMWGQMADVNGSGSDYVQFYQGNGPSSITINMIRAVARIEVGVDINGLGDPALGFGNIFEIDSVYLCNTRTRGTIPPHNDYLSTTAGVRAIEIMTPNPVVSNDTTIGYKFEKNEGVSMVRTIYALESDTLDSPANNKPAFLVIKATYYDKPYYYRVDFVKDGKYLPLLRNHSYTVNIVGVKTTGYDELVDALDSRATLNNPSLLFDAGELDLNESITNEQYYLAYSAEKIMIDWNEQIRIPVKTNYPGGWTATGDATGSAGVNTKDYATTTTLTPNKTGRPITHTVTISAGTLKKDITVVQSPGSNSYILHSGETIYIPLASADIDGTTRSTLIRRLSHYWSNGDDIKYRFSITDGTIIEVSGVGAITDGGNKYIYAHDSDDNIIWGWHIWAVPAGIDFENPTYQRHNNGFIFMDRNLGAYANNATITYYGNYYQWGRKDLISYDLATNDIFLKKTVSYSNNLDTAICNPITFYTSTSYPYDWIGTDAQSQNNNLWVAANGEKGVYDPCPFGWRVPVVKDTGSGSPWHGFTTNSRNGAVYPLSGYLDGFSGARYDASNKGAVWSASAKGMEAYMFEFSTTSASIKSAIRANGLPVRCVKDIP
ncbi:hypothetical protein M2459_002881 [Parabacteroides sp. PF5-5]|uniref:hypothetical protein n=1 Tax=unclassified Parabacteroides TaxID=2649774 RepID=UPI0024764964|nr:MULTISPECIES: hypothetical protein [unclassified Parabacteroides]MDH6306167.1 hypothetical protein [Parabacteroides sp. PH5-39]MDH6317126.1 hypothetical protein [Parabacteroides sp. PF5-13]MDH6320879.1 hypothetical protein [Parabacteroides sp. PH5-13]MDH6324610.1 hypothetical protein [Parabacteroides sp. PH5-8]MDH6328339.1 hypothetical protein [Parabacteroides sp. PH5-41]